MPLRFTCLLIAFLFIIPLGAQQLHIQFDSVEVYSGDTIGVDFIVSGFENIFSIQMPIRWEGEVANLVINTQSSPSKPLFTAHPSLGNDYLFNYATFPDTLLIQWMAPFGASGIQPKTLDSGTVMLTLYFKAVGNAGMETSLDTFLMAFGVEIMALINNQDVQLPLTTSKGRIRIIEDCDPVPSITYDTLYLCANESQLIHGQNISQSGLYNFTLENNVFCDSAISITVFQYPADSTFLTAFSCSPADTGYQYSVFQNINGCDSIVIEFTSLLVSDTILIENLVCEGTSIAPDTTFLINQSGCDSLIVNYFTAVPPDTSVNTIYVCSQFESSSDTSYFLNALGCDSIVISNYEFIPVIYQTTSLSANCATNNGSAEVITDPAMILSIQWIGFETSFVQTGLSEGVYVFELVTIHGCIIVDSVEVGVQSGLNLTVSNTVLPCEQAGNWTINALSSGGTGSYSYLWNTGDSSASINVEPNIYTLVVTDSEGCTAEIEFETTISGFLDLDAQLTNPSCFQGENGSILLQNLPPGTTFIWAGLNDSGSIAQNLNAGIYTVLVADPFGCTGIDSFQLNEPDPITIITELLNPICGSTPGIVSAQGQNGQSPYNYQWSNGNSGSVVGVQQGGWLSVTVTDNIGCIGVDSLFTEAFEGVQLSVQQQNISCYGAADGSIDVSAMGGTEPFTFQWSHGPQHEDISNLTPGIYEINVEDANGCLAAATINISQPDSLTLQHVVSEHSSGHTWNVTTTVTGGIPPYQYLWNNGATTPFLNNVPGALYQLTVTDANGCSAQLSAQLGPVSSDNPFTSSNFIFYPNPATTHLIIQFKNQSITPEAIRLFDGNGKLLANYVDSFNGLPHVELKLPALLPSGVYIIELLFHGKPSVFHKHEVIR